MLRFHLTQKGVWSSPRSPIFFYHKTTEVKMCFICKPDTANTKSIPINYYEERVLKVESLCIQNLQLHWAWLCVVEFCTETCVGCFLLFFACLKALSQSQLQFCKRIFSDYYYYYYYYYNFRNYANIFWVINVYLWWTLRCSSSSALPALWNLLKKMQIVQSYSQKETLNCFWKLHLHDVGL